MLKQKVYSKLNGIFLLIIGLVFVVLSFYVDDNIVGSTEQSSINKAVHRKPVDLINEHLQKSYDKEIINKINVINQNQVFAPNLKDAPEETSLNADEISELYGGAQYEDLIRKDLNEKNHIQDKIYQKELESKGLADKEEVQRKYRQKYAKTFLERSRKDGYEVELDEDYRVKAVSKIKTQKKIDVESQEP